jgi:hypothetical protein
MALLAVYIGRGNYVITRNNKTRKSFTRFYCVSTASSDVMLQEQLTLPPSVSCHLRSCLTVNHGPSSHLRIGRDSPKIPLPPKQNVVLVYNKSGIVSRSLTRNPSRVDKQLHKPSGVPAETAVQKSGRVS